MRMNTRTTAVFLVAVLTLLIFGGGDAVRLCAKEKTPTVSSDDPTLHLYSLLDSKFNGKLEEFYLLADVLTDPKTPDQPQQHVLRVDYSKDRGFGKLTIRVRTVGQLTPEQLKTYSPKQVYDFGEDDSAKFTKTDPGSFGRTGDVYFQAVGEGGALGAANVTPEVQAEYDRLVNTYIIPALEKKSAGGSGS